MLTSLLPHSHPPHSYLTLVPLTLTSLSPRAYLTLTSLSSPSLLPHSYPLHSYLTLPSCLPYFPWTPSPASAPPPPAWWPASPAPLPPGPTPVLPASALSAIMAACPPLPPGPTPTLPASALSDQMAACPPLLPRPTLPASALSARMVACNFSSSASSTRWVRASKWPGSTAGAASLGWLCGGRGVWGGRGGRGQGVHVAQGGRQGWQALGLLLLPCP